MSARHRPDLDPAGCATAARRARSQVLGTRGGWEAQVSATRRAFGAVGDRRRIDVPAPRSKRPEGPGTAIPGAPGHTVGGVDLADHRRGRDEPLHGGRSRDGHDRPPCARPRPIPDGVLAVGPPCYARGVRDDVGQLLWVGFAGHRAARRARARASMRVRSARRSCSSATSSTRGRRRRGAAGGLRSRRAGRAQPRRSTAAAPDGTPALIAVDQEGGVVQRVRAPATQWPPMMCARRLRGARRRAHRRAGRSRDRRRAARARLRHRLRAGPRRPHQPGEPDHRRPRVRPRRRRPWRGARSRSRAASTRRASSRAASTSPATATPTPTSHLELPRDRSRRGTGSSAVELAPFRAAAQARLADDHDRARRVRGARCRRARRRCPSRWSPASCASELGYRGVIVSDDLDMKAIADHIGADDAAVARDPRRLRRPAAVPRRAQPGARRGSADHARPSATSSFRAGSASAAARVRAMKRAHAENQARRPAPSRDVVGSFEHRTLADRLAGRA